MSLLTIDDFNAEATPDNQHIVISLGTAQLTVTIADAKSIGEYIKNQADLPSIISHIDEVFEGWGDDSYTDGGTC